jgi:hypothetical protein
MYMIKRLFFICFIFFITNVLFANTNIQSKIKNNQSDVAYPNTKKIMPKTYVNYYQSFKSIMFSTKDIADISKVLPKFEYINQSEGMADNSSEKFKNLKSIFNFTNGNIYIYLNSIMYVSEDSWSIWINGVKITNLNNDNKEISVKIISPSSIKLAWTFDSEQWGIINPNNLIPKSNYNINNNMITLVFYLSPNQTYIPATNQITEGKPEEIVTKSNTETDEDKSNKPQTQQANQMSQPIQNNQSKKNSRSQQKSKSIKLPQTNDIDNIDNSANQKEEEANKFNELFF